MKLTASEWKHIIWGVCVAIPTWFIVFGVKDLLSTYVPTAGMAAIFIGAGMLFLLYVSTIRKRR